MDVEPVKFFFVIFVYLLLGQDRTQGLLSATELHSHPVTSIFKKEVYMGFCKRSQMQRCNMICKLTFTFLKIRISDSLDLI